MFCCVIDCLEFLDSVLFIGSLLILLCLCWFAVFVVALVVIVCGLLCLLFCFDILLVVGCCLRDSFGCLLFCWICLFSFTISFGVG